MWLTLQHKMFFKPSEPTHNVTDTTLTAHIMPDTTLMTMQRWSPMLAFNIKERH